MLLRFAPTRRPVGRDHRALFFRILRSERGLLVLCTAFVLSGGDKDSPIEKCPFFGDDQARFIWRQIDDVADLVIGQIDSVDPTSVLSRKAHLHYCHHYLRWVVRHAARHCSIGNSRDILVSSFSLPTEMKLRMAKAQAPERRHLQQCPFCKSTAITRETTMKSTTTTRAWRCSPCGKTWPERRKAAA